MELTVPFSGHCTASLPAENNKHRLKIFMEFCEIHGKTLDIGSSNYIGQGLGIGENTHGDLNRGVQAHSSDYDVITCFEVLNHVMNPLLLVQECHRLLKPGGKLYLSTPLLWLIPWFHGPENFSEYKKSRVRALAEYAGFKVLRYEWHNPWPLRFAFYGIRPPFRYLFNRFQLWELEK